MTNFSKNPVFSRFFGYIGGGGPGGNRLRRKRVGVEGRDAYPNPGAPHPIAPIIRSYPGETVASRPICETKHQWVDSVLRWGTTRESSMVNVLAVGDQAGITRTG